VKILGRSLDKQFGMTNYHIGPHIGLSGTTSECMAPPHRTGSG